MALDFRQQFRSRLDQVATFISEECSSPPMSIEALLDTFLALWADCRAASNQTEHISAFVSKYDPIISNVQKLRVNLHDFELVKTLATGAVGKVCLVKGKADGKAYAMKILKKTDLLTRREAAFFMEERNALVFARSSIWMTTLFAAFQDEENLYLVMEYASGGSLRSLINSKDDPMSEDEARFYVGEMLLALEELHNMNYIHRDLKPENCLIDSTGHLKLADFGSCMRTGSDRKITSNETVGTPDYISPEILRALEGNVSYGAECDWWSLGIILFELLFDEVPFYAESLTGIYNRIMDHEKHFVFPDDREISEEVKDLITKLICKKEVRLGRNGAEEIKKHPWFSGFDFSNARQNKPPFVPQLSGPDDTRYFEDEEGNEMKKIAKRPVAKTKEFAGQNLPFIGYTYVHNSIPTVSWGSLLYGGTGQGEGSSGGNTAELEKEIASLQLAVREEVKKGNEAAEALNVLRQKVVKDEKARKELQDRSGEMEEELKKLQREVREVNREKEHESQERMELETKLAKVKRQLDEEMRRQAELQELKESNDRLEKQLVLLQEEVEKENENSIRQNANAAELIKAKGVLEAAVEKFRKDLEDSVKERQTLSTKVETLSSQLMAETTKKAQIQVERSQISNAHQAALSDNVTLKSTINAQKSKLDKLNEGLSVLEREKALLEVELKTARSQLSDVKSSRDVLAGRVQDLERNSLVSQSGALEEITVLKTHISTVVKAREELTDQVGELTKSLAIKELASAEWQKKYNDEYHSHQTTRAQLGAIETKVSQQIDQIAAMEQGQTHNAGELEQLRLEVESIRADLGATSQSLKQRTDTVEILSQERSAILAERGELRTRVLKLNESCHQSNKRVSELEDALSSERKTRIALESTIKKLEMEREELKREVDRLVGRAATSRDAQNQLESRCTGIEEKLALEQKLRGHLEREHANLLLKAQALETGNANYQRHFAELEKKLEDKETIIQDVEYRLREQETRALMFQDRAIDAENQIERIKLEHDDKKVHSAKSADNLKVKSKFKNVFFRSNTIRSPDAERTTIRINDNSSDDDLRRVSEHTRRISNESASWNSTISSQTKLSEFVLELGPGETLSGMLKVPKGSKVKKGWKVQFAIIKDFAVFLYEREKDASDGLKPNEVVDIRADIFMVKSVAQNELIHVNGKEIDWIFKIQCGARKKHSDISPSPTSIAEAQKKVAKLIVDIELEEKLHSAAEKMLNVATDTQKDSIIKQINVSSTRLNHMKQELERAQSAIASAGGTTATEASPPSREEMVSLFEGDIASCKKLIEDLIETETRNRLAAAASKVDRSPSPDKEKNRLSMIRQNSNQSIPDDLAQMDRNLNKLKDELYALSGDDSIKIQSLLKKYGDINGHSFKSTQYFKPTECAVCHEPLWGTSNQAVQGVECHRCGVTTHKHCKTLIDVSCSDFQYVNNLKPLYFLAQDQTEKQKWIAGLEHFRREYEKTMVPPAPLVSTGSSSALERQRSKVTLSTPPTGRRR